MVPSCKGCYTPLQKILKLPAASCSGTPNVRNTSFVCNSLANGPAGCRIGKRCVIFNWLMGIFSILWCSTDLFRKCK